MQIFLVPKKFVFSVTSAWTANGVLSLTLKTKVVVAKEGRKKKRINQNYTTVEKKVTVCTENPTSLSYGCPTNPLTYLFPSSAQENRLPLPPHLKGEDTSPLKHMA